MIPNNRKQECEMNTWEKIYRWRQNITKFFSIETKVSISKETQRIHEEQSWLGIG